jgi:hypothetical protein
MRDSSHGEIVWETPDKSHAEMIHGMFFVGSQQSISTFKFAPAPGEATRCGTRLVKIKAPLFHEGNKGAFDEILLPLPRDSTAFHDLTGIPMRFAIGARSARKTGTKVSPRGG